MKNKFRPHQLIIPITALIPLNISAENVAIPAGAANTIVNFYFQKKPIVDSNKAWIAGDGDTSLTLTSTAFLNEVSSDTPDDQLNAGDYWIDYLVGMGRGKKADNSITMTADYSVFLSSGALAYGGTIDGDLIITGDLTVQGNFYFGDVSTDEMSILGFLTMRNRGVASGPNPIYTSSPIEFVTSLFDTDNSLADTYSFRLYATGLSQADTMPYMIMEGGKKNDGQFLFLGSDVKGTIFLLGNPELENDKDDIGMSLGAKDAMTKGNIISFYNGYFDGTKMSSIDTYGSYHQGKNTVQTTDDTETTLDTLEDFPTGVVARIEYIVVARQSDGSNRGTWKISATVYSNGAGAVIQGAPLYEAEQSDLDWDVVLETSGDDLLLKVTGDTAQTINWYSYKTFQANVI